MTERDFFRRLAKLDGWYKTTSGQIRIDIQLNNHTYVLCPTLALANYITKSNIFLYNIDDWFDAAKSLRLSKSSTIRIAEAEDNGNECDENVRKKLLKACKLLEKEK